jgi:hypothetical protein
LTAKKEEQIGTKWKQMEKKEKSRGTVVGTIFK